MRLLETDRDTICALATAPGAGAISVIRVSGANALTVSRRLAPFLPADPESHRVYYGHIRALDSDETLDEVLVSYFQEGRSFTNEPVLEISCHGSPMIADQILRNLVRAGARPARRGEFTYRAFMNGRLDLLQAESVLDLVQSRSQQASRLALRQLRGEASLKIDRLREDLTWVLAQLEANIDFASEDIEIAAPGVLAGRLEKILGETRALQAGYNKGRIIRNGYAVALVGRPNVGKSSLLNALVGESRAIVTDVPGTTRDFVEADWAWEGFRVSLIDTAGLRVTDDPVEKIGIGRTLEKIKECELILYVCAVGDADGIEEVFASKIPWEKTVVVVNKCDLEHSGIQEYQLTGIPEYRNIVRVSAQTGAGLPGLKSFIEGQLCDEMGEDSALVSNARHFQCLERVRNCVETALPLVLQRGSPDLIALELQGGLRPLHEILGIAFDDQVMDRVFGEFCLGK